MDQIRERLEQISELSADELKSLQENAVAEYKTLSSAELTEETVADIKLLADVVNAVKSEISGRETRASELASTVAEAAAIITGKTDDGAEAEADVDVIEEDDADIDEADLAAEEPAEEVTEEAPAEEEELSAAEEEEVVEEEEEEEKVPDELSSETAPEATAVAEPASENPNTAAELSAETIELESSEEPVTASANTDELQAPEDRRPNLAQAVVSTVAITAGADIPNVPMGAKLPNMRAVAQALVDRKKAWGNTTGGDGEKSTVAKFTSTYPENRTLDQNDLNSNRSKVEAVVAAAIAGDAEALVAAGGLSGPVENRYELFGLGDTDRPVRDSLLVFAADRGGIRYVTPPVIGDLNGSVSLWTLQNDIDAATEGAPDPVKPCLRVTAGAEVVVYTEAIPLCLTFGNLVTRTYPELVERHTELAMIWHARFAETRLLTRIGTLSTAVTAAAELGAARDIFGQIDAAAAGYRSRHRISDTAALRVIFPSWFKNALRADLIKQIPGDGNDDTFGLAEAKINAWFSVRNINVTWHMDGETGQIFGAQAAGALNLFPTDVIWYLFAEGTFLFLDGGELDLGLVRDSTLNGTNDYKIFLETFEGVAKIGVEAIKVTSKLSLLGSSSATTDLTIP